MAKIGKKLYKKFLEEYDTTICSEIHAKKFDRTFDFMDKEDFRIFEEMGGHENICPTVVGLASVWAVELLWDEIPKDEDIEKINTMEEAKNKFIRTRFWIS